MSGRGVRVVVTRAVYEWAEHEAERQAWVAGCLRRHVAADWVDLDVKIGRPTTTPCGTAAAGCCRPTVCLPISPARAPIPRSGVITDDLEDRDTATTILWPNDY
jgi:hypothetical protein